MSGSLTQFGIGKESTYGTAVAVNRWYEIISEEIKGNYPRLQAEALSAAYVDRADRYTVNNKGAAGTVELEPLTKGFGDWLVFMMGAVSTGAAQETVAYPHTATVGNLAGKFFTAQVGRADESGTVRPWTYEGGKVTKFEFSNSVDQLLKCSIDMDFEKESCPDSPAGVYALQTNAPVAGAEVLSWQGGYIEVGSTQIEVSEITISVDNALNVERYFINQTTSKKEPNQDGKRAIEWSFTTPYVNNDFWERVSSATHAGSYAELVARWEGLTLLGTTIYPSIELRIPVARFDEGGPSVSGPEMLEQQFNGVGLYDGTNSALTIEYVSADTTVLS